MTNKRSFPLFNEKTEKIATFEKCSNRKISNKYKAFETNDLISFSMKYRKDK